MLRKPAIQPKRKARLWRVPLSSMFEVSMSHIVSKSGKRALRGHHEASVAVSDHVVFKLPCRDYIEVREVELPGQTAAGVAPQNFFRMCKHGRRNDQEIDGQGVRVY